MTNSPHSDANERLEDNPRPPSGRAAPPAMPTWVKMAVVVIIVLALAFVILHLAGGGFGHLH